MDQKLVSVDTTTGAMTDVGPTAQPWIVLAWDSVAKVARVITAPYSPAGGPASPRLGTMDRCSGTITDGPMITIAGNEVRRAEGLAQDPVTGTFFITVGTTGTGGATQFLTEQNGTVDVATGAVTVVGSHQTLQDDGDCLTFIGPSLRLLDIASATSAGNLYALDKATGAVSSPLMTGPTVLRVSHDPTRDVVFTSAGTGAEPNVSARSFGKLDLTTGANTPLGVVLPATTHPGRQINGLLSAPKPSCL